MIHRVCLYLLLVYGLAWWFPWSAAFGSESMHVARGLSKFLLAALVFLGCAGHASGAAQDSPTQCASWRALLFSWAATFAGLGCMWLLHQGIGGEHRVEIQLALLVIALMPVANSTMAWANLCDANRVLSLFLLLASTLTAPLLSLAVAILLYRLGAVQAPSSPLGMLVSNPQTVFLLIQWVLVPAAIGILASRAFGWRWQVTTHACARALSLPVLLVLNYINASICLPMVPLHVPLFCEVLVAVVGFQVVSVLSFRAGNALRSHLLAIPADHQVSIRLAILLRNTGAALVLVQSMLPEHSVVMLTILVATISQHVLTPWLCQPPTSHFRVLLVGLGIYNEAKGELEYNRAGVPLGPVRPSRRLKGMAPVRRPPPATTTSGSRKIAQMLGWQAGCVPTTPPKTGSEPCDQDPIPHSRPPAIFFRSRR